MLYSSCMVEKANSVYASIEPSLYLSLTRVNKQESQIYDDIKPTLPKRYEFTLSLYNQSAIVYDFLNVFPGSKHEIAN